MSEAEEKLAAFWREDGLADHDPGFAIAVMERMVRRRLYAGLASLAGVSILGGLVLWAFLPFLNQMAAWLGRDSGSWGPVGIAAVVTLSLLATMAVLPAAGPPRRMTNV